VSTVPVLSLSLSVSNRVVQSPLLHGIIHAMIKKLHIGHDRWVIWICLHSADLYGMAGNFNQFSIEFTNNLILGSSNYHQITGTCQPYRFVERASLRATLYYPGSIVTQPKIH
jgi:hypothetical protein